MWLSQWPGGRFLHRIRFLLLGQRSPLPMFSLANVILAKAILASVIFANIILANVILASVPFSLANVILQVQHPNLRPRSGAEPVQVQVLCMCQTFCSTPYFPQQGWFHVHPNLCDLSPLWRSSTQHRLVLLPQRQHHHRQQLHCSCSPSYPRHTERLSL